MRPESTSAHACKRENAECPVKRVAVKLKDNYGSSVLPNMELATCKDASQCLHLSKFPSC
eukprot:6252493-Amphidinium_carterae.1